MNNGRIDIGIDVDGTLTKNKMREAIMMSEPSIIRKEMLNVDPKDGIDILFENEYRNKFNIYIITGRLEAYRQVTTDWLNIYGIPFDELIMFPDDFYQLYGYSVSRYVGQKLDIHIKKNIQTALDDNVDVVNTFNECGIVTCQVRDDFRYAFEKILKLKNLKI